MLHLFSFLAKTASFSKLLTFSDILDVLHMAVCDIPPEFLFSRTLHWEYTTCFYNRSVLSSFECNHSSPSLGFSLVGSHNLDPGLLPFSLTLLNQAGHYFQCCLKFDRNFCSRHRQFYFISL